MIATLILASCLATGQTPATAEPDGAGAPAKKTAGLAPAAFPANALRSGAQRRTISLGKEKRTYFVYVPTGYDPAKPTPLVLALHGAAMDGRIMEVFSGLSKKAEKEGFIVAYPNGTGLGDILLTWAAGKFPFNGDRPDDVNFLGALIDDLAGVVHLDRTRVYATGMSNGGMMAYRLAAQMSDRIAAIAPVAGCMMCELKKPARRVPILHIHGTKDPLVPFELSKKGKTVGPRVGDVEATSLKPWREFNGCAATPRETELPTSKDKLRVIRREYTASAGGADVVLVLIDGGGHTWPGMDFHAPFCGETTHNIVANDAIWEFFRQHRLPDAGLEKKSTTRRR